jgi:transcriptional regulator with XRE-family HTH domain
MALLDQELLNKQIGSRIKLRRIKLGLTQLQLADRVDLSRTSIANIEAGQQCPPLSVFYNICHELGTEPNLILPSLAEVALNSNGLADGIAAELKQLGRGKIADQILSILNKEE